MAALDDVDSQALWRSVRASILAHEERFDEAVALAEAAVALVGSTDGVLKQAEARVVLAEVLIAAGRSADAERFAAEAVALYEGKGNEIAANRLRSALGEGELGRTREPAGL